MQRLSGVLEDTCPFARLARAARAGLWVALAAQAACGSPPNLPPTAPTVSISPASPRTDDDLVAHLVVPSSDPENGLISHQYLWVADGLPMVDLTTDRVPAARTRRGQRWSVIVTPNDGFVDGPVGTSAVSIDNTAPTAAVQLRPENPSRAAGLRAEASVTDPDDDLVTFTYAWTKNGLASDVRTPAVPAAELVRGDVWMVTVVASDGTAQSAPVSAMATLGNVPPSVGPLALTPAQPTRSTAVRADTPSPEDVDGDPITLEFAWTVAGEPIPNETTNTLAPRYFRVGQIVEVTVTPRDGRSVGDSVTARATILNAPPTAPVAALPTRVRDDEPIVCAIAAESVDPDEAPVTYAFTWTRNGQPFFGATLAPDGMSASIPAGATAERDPFGCLVTASDGITTTPAATTLVARVNARPTLAALTLGPAAPTRSTPLVVDAPVILDDDADPVTLRYAWRVDGLLLANENAPVLSTARFRRDQRVTVEVTPNDGLDDGPVASDDVIILNAPPTAPVASITANPVDADDITCAVTTPSFDADGDSVTYAFTWLRNGSPFIAVSNQSMSSVVPASATSTGDVFTCSVAASDGMNVGVAAALNTTIGDCTRLVLDGVNGRVEVPDNPRLTLGASDFTAELFVSLDALPTRFGTFAMRMLAHDVGSGGFNKWFLTYGWDPDPSQATLSFHINDRSWSQGVWLFRYPAALVPNRWYHVAVVRAGATASLFLDGRLVASEALAVAIPDVAAPFQLGHGEQPNDYLAGSLRDVRLSSTARYGANFAVPRTLVADAQTIALWRLDEGSGASVFDDSTNVLHGTVLGGNAWQFGVCPP